MSKLDIDKAVQPIFQTIEESDVNASTVIEVLLEDEEFLDSVKQRKEGNEALEKLYLSAVFYNRVKTQELLTHHGFGGNMVSSSGGGLISVEGANDVCWAVLSASEDALFNLQKLYKTYGMSMEFNQKQAIPFSNVKLGNKNATQHSPLDLAVMLYVAQKRSDLEKSQQAENMAGVIPDAIRSILGDVLEDKSMTTNVMVVPSGVESMLPEADNVERKILLLIEMGAQGSREAYFPVADESLDDPFRNNQGFEIMSMEDFCKDNAALFSKGVMSSLTNKAKGVDTAAQLKL